MTAALDHISPDDAALLASVRLGEGLRLVAYPDPLSALARQLAMPIKRRAPGWATFSGAPWTCGYGHTSPDIDRSTVCTEALASAWLISDLTDAMRALDHGEPWWRGLSAERQRVLCEMCFNLGLGRLSGFHRMLADLQAGKWSDAADEMDSSAWAGQIGGRAKRLADRMRAG